MLLDAELGQLAVHAIDDRCQWRLIERPTQRALEGPDGRPSGGRAPTPRRPDGADRQSGGASRSDERDICADGGGELHSMQVARVATSQSSVADVGSR